MKVDAFWPERLLMYTVERGSEVLDCLQVRGQQTFPVKARQYIFLALQARWPLSQLLNCSNL